MPRPDLRTDRVLKQTQMATTTSTATATNLKRATKVAFLQPLPVVQSQRLRTYGELGVGGGGTGMQGSAGDKTFRCEGPRRTVDVFGWLVCLSHEELTGLSIVADPSCGQMTINIDNSKITTE